MRLKGAIFDLDGTLLDSMGVWDQVDVEFLGRRGLPVPPDYMEAINPLGFRAAAEYTIARFGFPETPEELIAEWNELALEAYRTQVQLKPQAKELLEALRARGVKLAVATASQEELFRPALERAGVLSLFDAVTTLTEVGRGKGFPDIYWRAAEKLGLSPGECAVFEDIYAGVRAARDGGFMAVGVYEPFSQYEQEKIQAAADLYLMDFGELLGEVEKL